jgi:leader peptidase (prepilin peptidase) / N-methyltransferase
VVPATRCCLAPNVSDMTATAFLAAFGALGGAGAGWLAASAARRRWTVAWPPSAGSAVSAVLCAACAVMTGVRPEVAAYWFLAVVAVLLTMIDVAVRRLPNLIVLTAYPIGAGLLTAAAAMSGDWWRLHGMAVGMCVLLSGYLALFLAHPGGLGLGDVKVAGLVGGYLGWAGPSEFVVGACAAFVLGGCAAVVLLLAGRVERGSAIPFGPWMFAGAFVGIIGGRELVRGYVSLLAIG